MNTETQAVALWLADQLDKVPEHGADPDLIERSSAELRRLHVEHEALRKAVIKLHSAKGRYHTQLAVCDLFDLCGLTNERPKK